MRLSTTRHKWAVGPYCCEEKPAPFRSHWRNNRGRTENKSIFKCDQPTKNGKSYGLTQRSLQETIWVKYNVRLVNGLKH